MEKDEKKKIQPRSDSQKCELRKTIDTSNANYKKRNQKQFIFIWIGYFTDFISSALTSFWLTKL